MYTLKGVFPEPKRDQHKKNFIRENMKQLKSTHHPSQMSQSKANPKYLMKSQSGQSGSPQGATLSLVHSSPSGKSEKLGVNVSKTSSSGSKVKKMAMRIKKGDMAEFLKRKEMLKQQKVSDTESSAEDEVKSTASSGVRDIGCQTMDMSKITQQLEDSTKLTVLYPNPKKNEEKLKASGDTVRSKPQRHAHSPPHERAGDQPHDYERPRSRLNSILERKDNNKDPYLPAGYQKGVLPKYLRERKEHGAKEMEGAKAQDGGLCPPGHVLLPDTERRETLRMLRNSFAELVNELNKMPVKTDTLRMRNRKMELEKQLAKLEEGIKVFSRPKVFVKIGE